MGKYSQLNEEEILKKIFQNAGTTNKYFVEFGSGNGYSNSNTRHLKEKGWNGLMMDGFFDGNIDENRHKEFITAENICDLFRKHRVPDVFDLLSIDLDGNDLWILGAILEEYSPRIIVAEFNPAIPVGVNQTIEYNPDHEWNNDDYYGASFEAFGCLGSDHGYRIVDNNGLNLFLLRNDIELDGPYNNTYTERHDHKPSSRTDWVKY